MFQTTHPLKIKPVWGDRESRIYLPRTNGWKKLAVVLVDIDVDLVDVDIGASMARGNWTDRQSNVGLLVFLA